MKITWFIAVICLVFGGCSYGYEMTTSATPISGKSYPVSTAMPEVYFDDNTSKEYKPHEQIAFIEVKGARFSETASLLGEMKKKAASLGADAIIAVKQHYINRQRGDVLGEIIDKEKNKPESYDTVALTGLAIKYK